MTHGEAAINANTQYFSQFGIVFLSRESLLQCVERGSYSCRGIIHLVRNHSNHLLIRFLFPPWSPHGYFMPPLPCPSRVSESSLQPPPHCCPSKPCKPMKAYGPVRYNPHWQRGPHTQISFAVATSIIGFQLTAANVLSKRITFQCLLKQAVVIDRQIGTDSGQHWLSVTSTNPRKPPELETF